MSEEQPYINFDEYIRQGEPQQKERAEAWRVAIGLQAVDGLKTSEYLQQTARRNIEGEITIDEARELVKEYYIKKTAHDNDDADKEEADRVSSNISKLLQTNAFTYSVAGLAAIHRDIFDNDLFERHSWYFRNALVRANYRNLNKGINYEPLFLVRFFRNLLLGENNTLKNRYMLVNAPEQVPEQVQDLLHTNNPLIIELIKVIGNDEYSVSQLMERTGLKHRPNFIEYHLNPAIADGYVRLLYPDKPHHPRQKYLLTVKGLALYNELQKHV